MKFPPSTLVGQLVLSLCGSCLGDYIVEILVQHPCHVQKTLPHSRCPVCWLLQSFHSLPRCFMSLRHRGCSGGITAKVWPPTLSCSLYFVIEKNDIKFFITNFFITEQKKKLNFQISVYLLFSNFYFFVKCFS